MTQHEVYEYMLSVEASLQTALRSMRRLRDDGGSLDSQKAYGGPDYPRHLSVAITKVEEALLWAGSFIPEPGDDD